MQNRHVPSPHRASFGEREEDADEDVKMEPMTEAVKEGFAALGEVWCGRGWSGAWGKAGPGGQGTEFFDTCPPHLPGIMWLNEMVW